MNMISFRSSHHLSVNLGQLSSVMEFLTALALGLFYTLCAYSASPGCYKYATYADDSQIYTPLQTKELLTAVFFTKSRFFRSHLDPLLLSKSPQIRKKHLAAGVDGFINFRGSGFGSIQDCNVPNTIFIWVKSSASC